MHLPTVAAFLLASALPALAANSASTINHHEVRNEADAYGHPEIGGISIPYKRSDYFFAPSTSPSTSKRAIKIPRPGSIFGKPNKPNKPNQPVAPAPAPANKPNRNTKHCANEAMIKHNKPKYGNRCQQTNSVGRLSAHNCGGRSYLCVQGGVATCYSISEARRHQFESGECFT